MKRFIFPLAFVLIFGGSVAFAQQNPPNPPADQPSSSMGQGSDEGGTDTNNSGSIDPGEDSPTKQAAPPAATPSTNQGGKTDGEAKDWGY